jgi:hypothetical protein
MEFLPDTVLGPQLLGKRGGHQLSSDVGRGRKVSLALLPAGASGKLVQLHSVDRDLAGREEEGTRLSFVRGSLGLNGPREDQPRPRGTLDSDILGSGTTGRQRDRQY